MFFPKQGRLRRQWDALKKKAISRCRTFVNPTPQPLRYRVQALPCEIKEMIILSIHDPITLSNALQVPELSSFTHPSLRLILHVQDAVFRTDIFSCPYHKWDRNKDAPLLSQKLRARYCCDNGSKKYDHKHMMPLYHCPYRKQAVSYLKSSLKVWLTWKKNTTAAT